MFGRHRMEKQFYWLCLIIGGGICLFLVVYLILALVQI